jgi:putative CocE/NonD family hydrolase
MGDPASNDTKVNEWRTANDWPIPGTTNQIWYFHPNGTLSTDVPQTNQNLTFIYDPANPMKSRGGTDLMTEENLIGAMDQRPVEVGRTDLLNFTTPILNSPVEIVGRINATLTIASNCTDTDFFVKLMDIFPDGKMMWIADGILKTRYRNNFYSSTLMNPGQQYELNIDMWSTAYRFVPGHKIHISVTSSSYQKYALNPNNGGVVSNILPANYSIASNTVICGGAKPSGIIFPRSN